MVVRRAPEQGMTLVELMVTMVIASIVAASTFMFFAGQQRVYETQTKMLNVQQNAWAAMEVLTRFVRASGSGMYGCVRPVGGIVPAPPLNRKTGLPTDDSDDPPVAVTRPPNLSQRPSAGLRAYAGGTNMQRIPPLWIADQVVADTNTAKGFMSGTDVITVAFGNGTSGTTYDSWLATPVSNATGTITTKPDCGVMFQANEFILLVNDPSTLAGSLSDIGCTLFQISSVSGDRLLHASTQPWNPGSDVANMIPTTYPAGGGTTGTAGIRDFGQFWWVQFAVMIIDPNNPNDSTNPIHGLTNPGIPVLTMQRLDGATTTGPQVLAEGIEDLQVAFACDLDNNGLLREDSPPSITDEWTLNAVGDPIEISNARKCNQPSAIRLTLVARSLTEDNGIAANANFNGPPTVENHWDTCCCQAGTTCAHANTTCCDQYRRRVLSTTVYPRNN